MSKNVKAEFLKGGKIRLIRPFEEVPRGFICDGASVPRFFWRFLGHPFDNYHLKPGIRHDYGYAMGKVPRKVLDKRYRDDLKYEGLGFIRRNLEYFGVRVFGRRHYNSKGAEVKMKANWVDWSRLAICVAVAGVLSGGCMSTEEKAVDIGGKGLYTNTKTGKMAIGAISVSTIPAGAESVVFKVDEDTAWLSDRFLRDMDLRLTGTNAVSHCADIVKAICETLIAPTNSMEQVNDEN